MIFRSNIVKAHWDTWCYFHEDTYYLYYLITETSPGEGFGVAASNDGLNWEDHGWAIRASDRMVHFLGTGSVWPDPCTPGRFLCNYSEHRLDETGKQRQCILFAWSNDLITWYTFGDEHIFWIDERYYERYGRWDCIYAIPRSEGGFFGTWTATPRGRADHNGGIGFGVSDNGVHWQALPPASIIPDADESGAMISMDGRIHAMFGRFGIESEPGMHAYRADSINGPFHLAEKNSLLLYAWHTYFSRFFNTPDGVLVNHHAMDGRKLENGRPVTYLAPFKKFTVDTDGIQRWMWWPGNEKLKGTQVIPTEWSNFQQGIVIEGYLEFNENKDWGELIIEVDDSRFIIRLSAHGKMTVLTCDPENNTTTELQKADR